MARTNYLVPWLYAESIQGWAFPMLCFAGILAQTCNANIRLVRPVWCHRYCLVEKVSQVSHRLRCTEVPELMTQKIECSTSCMIGGAQETQNKC